MPSFFRMHVSTIEPINKLENLTKEDFAVFFHEYIHFIQDISTYYGLFNADAVCSYMRFANNHVINNGSKHFNVPIEPDPNNIDFVFLKNTIIKITYGDVASSSVSKIIDIHESKLPLNLPNCTIAHLDVFDIEFTNANGEDNFYTFGAGCIMESMAYTLEMLTCKGHSKSPDLPYTSAELVAQFLYPAFCNNPLNVLALCDVSLGTSNPSNYFVSTLKEWRDKSVIPSKPEDLYDEFRSKQFIRNGGAIADADDELVRIASSTIIEIGKYFNMEHFDPIKRWVAFTIIAAIEHRSNHPYFILDFAKQDPLSSGYFKYFFNKIGTPLITNDRNAGTTFPGIQDAVDLSVFWAISQIQEFFLGKLGPCKLFGFCNKPESEPETDDRCHINPWSRSTDKDLCPFALFWKHWALTGFEPQI